MEVRNVESDLIKLYETATRGHPNEQTGAAQQLEKSNPGVSDLVKVYKMVEEETGEKLSSNTNLKDGYQNLHALAGIRSGESIGRAASPNDLELAANSIRNHGSVVEIEEALSGVTNTRNVLKAQVMSAFTDKDDPVKFERDMAKLNKMDPDLAQRMQDVARETDATKSHDKFIAALTDVHEGEYDKYALSKAGYEFNRLAKMDPKDADYKQTFEKLSPKENEIIGPYLEGLKKLEVALSKDGELTALDHRILNEAQKGFSDKIRQDQPMQQADVQQTREVEFTR